MKIAMTIPGEPQGKARPRFDSRNRRTYTPKKTKDYEDLIATVYQMRSRGATFGDRPVVLLVRAQMGVPKSDSAKTMLQKLQNMIRPTKKPDWDNIGKIVCDALNGLAWHDDAQIVDARVQKFYSDEPRVEIIIKDLQEDNP